MDADPNTRPSHRDGPLSYSDGADYNLDSLLHRQAGDQPVRGIALRWQNLRRP